VGLFFIAPEEELWRWAPEVAVHFSMIFAHSKHNVHYGGSARPSPFYIRGIETVGIAH
jgi:hypothetical protein